MSSEKRDDGGQAFPRAPGEAGMSLRDWFAGQALAGITQGLMKGIRPDDVPLMARDCYGIADSMLAERAKAERSQP